MKRVIVFALLAFIGATAPAAAQTFGFGAHAGVSFPTGDYGDFVETGFSGGLDLWYPLSATLPLSWYTSADAVAHSVEDSDSGFLYFPLMTGLRFDVPVGPAALFATGQLGVVFTRGPDNEVFGDAQFGAEFGYNVGGGVQLTDNVYAGVKYYPLGDIDFEYDGAGENFDNTADVSFFDIYVGFGVN